VRAGLANFDVEGDEPKPEHTRYLDRSVVPLLVGARARVWLQGQTSSTGTNEFNLDLSKRRCDNVAAYLRSRGVGQPQITPSWVGESLASVSMRERSDDRVVWLLAAPLSAPPAPPPSPPSVHASTPRNTKFKIRMVGGLSGGAKVGIDQLFFQIWDEKNGVTSFYTYSGIAIGKSWKSVSTTLKGPWNDFETTGEVAVDEFGGAARFTTGGAGSYTLNYLNMMRMPRGTKTSPNPLELSTGVTVGIGLSTGVGGMFLQSTSPFHGP
jgi:hypothetical protein